MSVYPTNYDLIFEPDLERFVFSGKEIITVQCTKPTRSIKLDCAELEILSCTVLDQDTEIPCKFDINEESEELHIKLSNSIQDTCTIHLEFNGTLNDRLLGFYRSEYIQDGKTKYLATSQFEAADARRAFPCWDRPDAKATFEIRLVVKQGHTAISNMPIVSKTSKSQRTTYKFAKTPLMSTYLVYLGVGEFEYLKSKIRDVEVRVVTIKGSKSKGRFALDLGKRLLDAYEKYFGIKYPLPKLDLIAVPDFAAGAMENWGAITFRETILLYDPKTSSTKTKQFIAEVISHEIAHQWFGNLVTMKWWNDLWLNESFATFMATKFVAEFYPEWDMWDQFIEDAMNTAMELDALKTTHPIDVDVRSPSQIREIFDAISYDKGGCILRMIEHYVGEANFRRGLKEYLKKFAYKNAQGQDLWDAISKASTMPVSSMVQTWLKQPGFPLVDVKQTDYGINVSQSRYLLEHKSRQGKGLWHIPISVQGSKTKQLLVKDTNEIKITKNANVIVNSGRTGFYRIRYDKSILLDLKMLVDKRDITPIDRWAIQNDLFSLCKARRETVRDYLDFTDAYVGETDYLVSINVGQNLVALYNIAFNEPFVDQIRAYGINYLQNILKRVGWEKKREDRHTDALLRSFVITSLGRMNHPEVIREVQSRYTKLIESPNSISPDLIESICSIAAWKGNAKTHHQITEMYKSAESVESQLRFLGALCGFQSTALLHKTLNFAQTKVRSQNMHLPIVKISENPYGKKIVWPWLVKNWNRLHKKIGHGNPLLNRIVASISNVADDTMEQDIQTFFERNPVPGTQRTISQTLERIRIDSKFLRSMQREF